MVYIMVAKRFKRNGLFEATFERWNLGTSIENFKPVSIECFQELELP